MLVRFDPFRDLDNVVRQAFAGPGRGPALPLDAYRQDDQYVVTFDLPGVDPASIDLTVEKNVLSVSAERRSQLAEDAQVIAAERAHGSFNRQLFLGEGLDADDIAATYENGVLTVVVPVAEQAKARRVPVRAGADKAEAIEAESRSA